MPPNERDTYRRRLIRAVAKLKPYGGVGRSTVFWDVIKGLMGCDCRRIWGVMCRLTSERVLRLLECGDVPLLVPTAARMTLNDWLLLDLVLVHNDSDIFASLASHSTVRPLVQIFHLVQQYKLERCPREQLAAAWTAATLSYNSQGKQSSPMLLQRRWWELKKSTREHLYRYWHDKANAVRPAPLHIAIARRFSSVITEKQPKWAESVARGLVVLPNELEAVTDEEVQLYKEGLRTGRDIVPGGGAEAEAGAVAGDVEEQFLDVDSEEDDVVMLEPAADIIDLDSDSGPEDAGAPVACAPDPPPAHTDSDDDMLVIEDSPPPSPVQPSDPVKQPPGLAKQPCGRVKKPPGRVTHPESTIETKQDHSQYRRRARQAMLARLAFGCDFEEHLEAFDEDANTREGETTGDVERRVPTDGGDSEVVDGKLMLFPAVVTRRVDEFTCTRGVDLSDTLHLSNVLMTQMLMESLPRTDLHYKSTEIHLVDFLSNSHKERSAEIIKSSRALSVLRGHVACDTIEDTIDEEKTVQKEDATVTAEEVTIEKRAAATDVEEASIEKEEASLGNQGATVEVKEASVGKERPTTVEEEKTVETEGAIIDMEEATIEEEAHPINININVETEKRTYQIPVSSHIFELSRSNIGSDKNSIKGAAPKRKHIYSEVKNLHELSLAFIQLNKPLLKQLKSFSIPLVACDRTVRIYARGEPVAKRPRSTLGDVAASSQTEIATETKYDNECVRERQSTNSDDDLVVVVDSGDRGTHKDDVMIVEEEIETTEGKERKKKPVSLPDMWSVRRERRELPAASVSPLVRPDALAERTGEPKRVEMAFNSRQASQVERSSAVAGAPQQRTGAAITARDDANASRHPDNNDSLINLSTLNSILDTLMSTRPRTNTYVPTTNYCCLARKHRALNDARLRLLLRKPKKKGSSNPLRSIHYCLPEECKCCCRDLLEEEHMDAPRSAETKRASPAAEEPETLTATSGSETKPKSTSDQLTSKRGKKAPGPASKEKKKRKAPKSTESSAVANKDYLMWMSEKRVIEKFGFKPKDYVQFKAKAAPGERKSATDPAVAVSTRTTATPDRPAAVPSTPARISPIRNEATSPPPLVTSKMPRIRVKSASSLFETSSSKVTEKVITPQLKGNISSEAENRGYCSPTVSIVSTLNSATTTSPSLVYFTTVATPATVWRTGVAPAPVTAPVPAPVTALVPAPVTAPIPAPVTQLDTDRTLMHFHQTGLPDTTLTPLPQPPTQQKLSSTTTTTITTTAAHKDSQLSATPRAKAITQMFPTLKPFHNIRRSESGLKCYPNNAYVLRIASGSKPIVFGFNSIFVTTADISTGDGEVSYWTLVDAGKPSRQLQLDATGGLSLLKSNDSLGYSRSMSFKLTPIKTSKSFKPTPTETAANVSEIALDRHYTTDIILEDSPEPDLLREPANKVIISGVRFQRFRANLYKVTLTAITDNAELKKLRYTHPLYEYNRVTGSLLPIDTDTILEQEKEQNIEKVLPMPLSVRPPPGLQTMSQSGILTDKKTVSLSEIISSMRLSHSSTSSFQNVAKESTLPKIVAAYSMSTSHRTLVTTPLPTESTVSPIEQMPSFLQSYNASKEKTPKGVPFVEYSKEKNCKTIYLPPIQNTTSCRPDECSSRDEVTKMVTLSAPQASEVSVVTSVSSGVTTYRPVIMTNQVLDLVAPNPQSGTQKVQNATVSKCGIVEISRNKPQKEMFKDSSATTVLPVSQSKNVKSPTKTVSIAQPKLNTNVTNNSLYISNEHMSFSTYVDLTETDVSTDVTGELPQRKYLSDLMTSPPSKTSASVNPQESSAHTNVMTDTTVSPSVFSVPVEVSPHVKKAEAMQHMRASLSMHVVAAPMFGKVGTVICLDSDEEDSNFPLQMEYAGNERRLPEPSGVVLPGPSVNTQKTNEIETEQSFQIEKLGKRKKSMDVEDSDAPGAATSSVYSKPTELEVLTIKQPMPYERKSMSDVEVMSEADELSKDAIIEILVIQTDNPTEIGKPKHMEKSIKIKEPVIMEKCTEIEELNKKGKPSEKPSIVRDFTEKEKPTELQGPNEIMMITLPSTQVLNLAAPNPQLAPMTAQNVSVSKCSIVEISRNKPHKKLFVDSSPSPVLSISQSKNATSSTITVSIAQTKLNSNVTSDSLCISNQHMSLSTCVDLTETDVSTDVTVELPQRRYLSCLMTSPPFNTSASVNAQESSAHTNVVKNTTVGPSVFSVPLEMSHRAKEAQGMQHMGASLSINVVDPHTFGKVDTAICLVSDEEDSNFPSQMEYVGNKRRFPEPSGVVLPALSVSTQKTDETQMKYSIQVEKLGKRTESTIVEESDASEAATYSEYSKPSELEGLTIEAPMVYERASMNDVNVLNDAEEPSKEDEMIEILQIETENPTEIAKPMHMEKSIEMKEPIITRKNTGMGEIKQSREIEKFAEMEEFYKKEKPSEKPPTIRDFTEKEEPAKLQGPKIKEPSEREEWEMEEPTETKGPTKMVEPAKKEKPSIARDTTEMKEPTETETPTDMQELKDIEKLTEAEKRIQIGGLEKLEGSTETDEPTEMEELTKKNKHSAIRDSTEIKEPMEIIKNMKMSANQSEKSIKMEELTKKEKPLTIKYSTERKEPTDTENPAEMQEPNEIEKPKANENPTRIGVLKQIKESQKTEAPSQMEQHTKNGESSTMKASTITKELTGMQDPIETEDTDIEETKKLEEPTETEGPMEMEQLTKKKNPLIIRHFREIKDSTETIKATGTHYPKEIEEPTEIEAMEMETLKNVEEPKEPKKIMEMEEPKKIGEHSETEPSAEVVELKKIEELTETEGPTEIEQLTITEKVLIIRDSTEIKAFTGTKKKQGMKPPKEIEELTKPEFTEMEASIDIEGTTETKKSMEMKEPKEKGKPFKTEQPTEMEEYKEIKEPTETEEPMKIEKLTNKEKPSTISDSTEIIPLLPQPPSPQALSFTTAAEHTDTKLSATEGSRNKVITQVPSSLKTLHKIKSDSGRACYPNNAYVLRLTSLSKAITFGENSILVTTADISPGNGEVSYWTLVQAGKPPRQLWLDGTGGLCPSQSNNIIDVTSKLTPTEAAANVSDITLDRKYTTNVILEDSPERELPRYPADKVVHAGVRYQRFGADTYKLTLTAITDRAVMRELCYKNFLYSYNIETGKLLCIRTDSTSKWYKGKCQKLQSGILTDKKTDSQSEIISSMTLSRLSTSSFQAVAKESTLPKIVEAYSMSTSHRTLVTMPLPTAESTVSPVEQSRPLLQSYNARRRTRRTEEQRYAYALIENFTQNMSLSKLNPRDVIMTTVTPSASPAPEGSVVTSISASVTTHRPVMASTEVFDLVAPDVQSDPLTTQNVRVSTRGISNISRNKPQNKLKFKDFSTALLQSKNAKSFTKTISIAQPKVNSNVTDNPLCISNQHMSFSTYVDLTETDTSTKVTVDLPQGSSSSNLKTFSPPNTSASWSSRQDHSGLSAVNTSLNTQPQEQESLAHTNIMKYTSVSPCVSSMPVEKSSCSQEAEAVELMRASMSNT